MIESGLLAGMRKAADQVYEAEQEIKEASYEKQAEIRQALMDGLDMECVYAIMAMVDEYAKLNAKYEQLKAARNMIY